jgi:hypothetical protein
MQFLPQQVESRREFFRGVVRYGLLAVTGAIAVLVTRSRAPASQRCVNRGICSHCGVFAECGLPQALSARRAKEKD